MANVFGNGTPWHSFAKLQDYAKSWVAYDLVGFHGVKNLPYKLFLQASFFRFILGLTQRLK